MPYKWVDTWDIYSSYFTISNPFLHARANTLYSPIFVISNIISDDTLIWLMLLNWLRSTRSKWPSFYPQIIESSFILNRLVTWFDSFIVFIISGVVGLNKLNRYKFPKEHPRMSWLSFLIRIPLTGSWLSGM